MKTSIRLANSFAIGLFFVPMMLMSQTEPYPEARRLDLVETIHGVEVADPYRWLEDDHSKETKAWVSAQNAFADAYFEDSPARNRFRSG